MAGGLKTAGGKQNALEILKPYGPNVAECVDIALTLSKDADYTVRLTAANFLAAVRTNPKAQARLFDLLEDGTAQVRNFAIQTVGEMDLSAGPQGSASAFMVVPNENQRRDAIDLLNKLERAVKVLEDLGLEEGQQRIVNDLILPDIETLKNLVGAKATSLEKVSADRKRAIVTFSGVRGSATALALTIGSLANAKGAAETVAGAAESLGPLVDMLNRLV